MVESPRATSEGRTRCGYVALVGAPNAGKSTLVNQLVGGKVSIVTPKVQTTRARALGICIDGAAQIVLVDTPGIFQPKRRLERAMVAAAWQGASDADLVLLLVDSTRGLDVDTRGILDGLAKAGRRAILALNKVDLVERPALLALADRFRAIEGADGAPLIADVFMISALTGDGVADLRAHLAARLPEGPWLFPEDQISDMPLRLLAAEVTREKLFLRLHQELPYSSTVETESWQERKDGSVRIEQVIYVRRDSQKAIVLGKGGRQIKAIGAAARAELAEMFDRPVHLFLFVKVREGWVEDRERYKEMGLDFDS